MRPRKKKILIILGGMAPQVVTNLDNDQESVEETLLDNVILSLPAADAVDRDNGSIQDETIVAAMEAVYEATAGPNQQSNPDYEQLNSDLEGALN